MRQPTLQGGSADRLSEFAAQNLTRGCLRDGIYKVDLAWLLVGGEALGYKGTEFFFQLLRSHKTVTQSNEGHRDFAGASVRTSDDSAFAYGRMFEQDSFNFCGRYRETLVLDHFLAAVDHAKEAFRVPSDYVA